MATQTSFGVINIYKICANTQKINKSLYIKPNELSFESLFLKMGPDIRSEWLTHSIKHKKNIQLQTWNTMEIYH